MKQAYGAAIAYILVLGLAIQETIRYNASLTIMRNLQLHNSIAFYPLELNPGKGAKGPIPISAVGHDY